MILGRKERETEREKCHFADLLFLQLRRTPSWLTGAFSSKSPNKSTASTSVSKESILGDSVRSEKPDLVRFPRRSSDTSSLQGRARSGSELSQIPESGISDYFDGKSPELAAFLQNREKPPTSEPSIPEATTAPHATTAPIPIESKPQPKVRSMLEVDPDPSPKSQVQPEVIEKPSETAVGVQSDARSETKVEVGPENKPMPKLRSMLDVDLSPEATPGVKSDVKPETRQEMGSENKLEVKPGGFPERRPSTRSSRSEPKLETMYEVDEPAPDVKPETKPEIKTDAAPVIVPKSESMPDIGSELRPGIIRELRPETKPHIEVEANADVKPDVTVDVEADAKADAKPEEVKLDPKPEVKINSSPVPKPEVRVDAKSQLRPVTKPRAKSSNDQGESDLAYPSTPRSSTWGDWLAWTQFTESQPNYKSHAVAAPQNTESPQERADRLRPNTASNSRSIDFDYSDDQPQSSLLSDLWDTAQRTVEAAIESRWPSSPKETSCKDSEDGWERYYPPPSRDQEPAQHQEATSKVGSNWGFWSKDRQDNEASVAEPAIKETVVQSQGVERSPPRTMESKVAESASQDTKEITADNCLQGSGTSTWARLPRVRSRSGSLRRHSASFSGTSTPTGLESPKLNSPGRPIPEAEVPLKAQRNLLLPSFSSTYRMKENPSILKQAARFLFGTKRPLEQPVYRTTDTPRIRKAVAIGVHGLFPAPYLRPMIGQPTGTSVRFAGLCADAIKKWADANGSSDCEIEKIALEGDGKIGDRVENLWKLLLNWADAIRSADLVIIACHSQGVPVSVILLEKLIDLGIITRNRVGVCAMAGVSLGPFADYRSGIFSGSAAELWDFGKRDSAISKRFELALKRVLDHGAHITFVGAIDDQVVPLEVSSSPMRHTTTLCILTI